MRIYVYEENRAFEVPNLIDITSYIILTLKVRNERIPRSCSNEPSTRAVRP
jgi:hypothetical protein